MTCGPFDKPLSGAGRALVACAALAAAAALAGCVTATSKAAQVDQSSPAAAEIAKLPQTLGPYPRWSDFPRGPQPTPPPSEIASRVAGLQTAQADLLSSASRIRWTLSGTAEFAANARAQVNPALATPAPADEATQVEAYVKALRERATPPPMAPK
jgi:hypothetical protein